MPVFEGPLDLLLYLIKKDEINIYDIPIAKITDQYVEHLGVMQLLDLGIAGEFILMAATLMHIKSKMLLPIEDEKEDMTEEADPREELVSRLLEYKRFKEAAGSLKDMRDRQRDSFARLPDAGTVPREGDESGFEASLFDLITAFGKVLKEIPKDTFHEVIKDEFTVSDKIHDILHILVEKQTILFSELFSDPGRKKTMTRSETVSIFLALLELVKLREIVLRQKAPFAEIEITRSPECQGK